MRSWTHLERQRGGFGFLGGPGETQIEADRRLIRDRMARIRRELEQVKRTRALHRGPAPARALAGDRARRLYERRKIHAFQPIDRRWRVSRRTCCSRRSTRRCATCRLPGFDKAILSDTVGFVSDLPTELIAAFRATLEEVASADLLIHVRDMAHPDREAQAADVEDVLTSLGIGEGGGPPGSKPGTRSTC